MNTAAFAATDRVVLNWEHDTEGATIGTVTEVFTDTTPATFRIEWDDKSGETLLGAELAHA